MTMMTRMEAVLRLKLEGAVVVSSEYLSLSGSYVVSSNSHWV